MYIKAQATGTMYQDDYTNEYVRDFLNDGFDENQKSNKKIFEDMRMEDKGYYSWKKNVEGSRKPIKIEAYSSGDTGSRIRDAITGDRYTYLVGSKYEDMFFKVRVNSENFGLRDAPTLFYASPEQYETHTKTLVASSIKEKWLAKKLALNIIRQKEMEKEDANDIIIR